MVTRNEERGPHGNAPEWTELESDVLAALEVIDAYISRHAMGPTLRELGAGLGLRAVSAVQRRIRQMEKLGLITFERTAGKRRLAARSLRLSPSGRQALARSRRLRASPLLRGAHEILLDARALAAARRARVPLSTVQSYRVGAHTLVSFPARAERDFWASLILDELERE